MNMSPLLFRRSLHSRAGLVLSSTMVARSDGDFLRSATMPSSPSLHPWWKTGRAVVFAGRALVSGLAIQNDSGPPQGTAGHSWGRLTQAGGPHRCLQTSC
jgi:hypothetical protein